MSLSELLAHFADKAPGLARRLARAGRQVDELRTSAALVALPVMRRGDALELLPEIEIVDPSEDSPRTRVIVDLRSWQ